MTRYTHRRDEPTVGVSCGHRVPRVPAAVPGQAGLRYWCEDCQAHRMAGCKATGEIGFAFLLQLRDDIARLGVTVDLDHEPTVQERGVMEALGARVTVRSTA